MNKSDRQEIEVISESPKRRPHAPRIALVLGEGQEFGFDGDACLLTKGKFIVSFKPDRDKSNQQGKSLQKLTATIEGFATAGEAEQMGLKLSLAILWASVSIKWPLKLDYHTPHNS